VAVVVVEEAVVEAVVEAVAVKNLPLGTSFFGSPHQSRKEEEIRVALESLAIYHTLTN
jgi:hypothetical protein